MNEIHGNNVLLEVLKDNEYIPFLCAKDMTINFNIELIATNTVGTGKGNTYKPRRYDWDLSLSGITSILGDGRVIFSTVNPTAILTPLSIKMTFLDSSFNAATFTGTVLLKSASISGNQDSFSVFENSLQGSGAYVLTVTNSLGTNIVLQ